MTSEYFDVVIVGAGLSGIGAACHLQRDCPGKRYVILEGRAAMGGTWDLFRYPGIRSDSDMHTLGYDFKPWRESKAIADGPSILRYINETAAEHAVDRHIRYRHRLVKASWSGKLARWTLEARQTDTNHRVELRCSMILMCVGYYRYEHGYTPDFAGRDRFDGEIVHPQQWPENLDYRGKKVVVIGSGATAVTLIPEMARETGHITMLQRSPSYVISRPDTDRIANFLDKVLPAKMAYAITRWKNIALQQWLYRRTRTSPGMVRRQLLKWIRKELGPDYDVETHFTPRYDPWDQRLCVVPNSDLFRAIRAGKASVVTDSISSFTEHGIRLESGAEIDADIIITATGLDLLVLGGAEFVVDGAPVDFSRTITYRGIMFSGVPNLVSTSGYINASWTWRGDHAARYICPRGNHMDAHGFRQCTPLLRPEDEGMSRRPWVSGFSSGYMRRAFDRLPKQGDRAPWINPQDYRVDRRTFLEGDIEDGVLVFDQQSAADAIDCEQRRAV